LFDILRLAKQGGLTEHDFAQKLLRKVYKYKRVD